MESCQVTVGPHRIEFHGVRNTYPVNESVCCYFTVPSSCKPETGDFIGIFPVGWSSINHCTCKRMVRPEYVYGTPSGHYGKVEFECEVLPKCIEPQQHYQFVYVKSGEYIRGCSTPFMFVPYNMTPCESSCCMMPPTSSIRCEEQLNCKPTTIETSSSIMSEYCIPTCETTTPCYPPKSLEQVVMKEIQTLQHGLENFFTVCRSSSSSSPCEEMPSCYMSSPFSELTSLICGGKPFEFPPKTMFCEYPEPSQVKKYWQYRITEVVNMLCEQIRIEQTHRRLEQLNIISQLKSCERHIMHVQKREQEIKSYLYTRMQKQVCEFEQKVYNIMKMSSSESPCNTTTTYQPEHYVRRYEQLLKEKIELDNQKRFSILHKLRQTIRECERKLREVQSGELQYYTRFQQTLKSRIGHFENKCIYPTLSSSNVVYSEQVQQELREQLRQCICSFVNEQRREQYNFVKSQKQLVCLVNEICSKLQCLECEAYTHLNIPRIQMTCYPFESNNNNCHPSYSSIQSLESQLNEIRNTLRVRLMTTPKVIEHLTSGEWIRPITYKLRELECCLRQMHSVMESSNEYPSVWSGRVGPFYERRVHNLNQIIRFFERLSECKQIEECRLREILCQLRELECEICELPQMYEQQYKCRSTHYVKQIVEMCQLLQPIIKEKISHLTSIYEQSPIECYIQSGNHHSFKQLVQFERKLAQLKCLMYEKHHYTQLQQRLVELEKYVKECCCTKSERMFEQIRCLRSLLEQNQQKLHYYIQTPSSSTHSTPYFSIPEHFIQHQHRYERLCQFVNELECQIYEQCRNNTTTTTTPIVTVCYTEKSPVCEYVEKLSRQHVFPPQQQVQQQHQLTMNMIHQRFERLVQEFQRQMPESYCTKMEPFVQFLKSVIVNESLKCKPHYGHQLREKICEFENFLQCCEPELSPCHIPTYRSMCRQIRELRSCIQSILDEWVIVNNNNNYETEENNNNVVIMPPTSFGSICEPLNVISETTLNELLCGRSTPYCEEFIPRLFRYHQQQQQQQQQQYENSCQYSSSNSSYCQPEKKLEQIERQMESIESLVQQTEMCTPTCMPTTTTTTMSFTPFSSCPPTTTLKSTYSVENLIGELESELVKLRLQKEYPTVNTTTTTRVCLTPESVCEEISKIVGQNLLTTVVPECRSTTVLTESCNGSKPTTIVSECTGTSSSSSSRPTTVLPEIRSTIVKVSSQQPTNTVPCPTNF